MAVNESKARSDLPQWTGWGKSPPGAIKLNTEEKSIEECVEIIRSNFN